MSMFHTRGKSMHIKTGYKEHQRTDLKYREQKWSRGNIRRIRQLCQSIRQGRGGVALIFRKLLVTYW